MAAADDFPSNSSTTGKLDVGGHVDGNFERGFDVDWYAITLQAGTRYLFSLASSSGIVPYTTGYSAYAVTVFGASGKQLLDVLPGSDIEKPVLEFAPAVDGTYYVAATSNYYWYGLGAYQLSAAVRTEPDDYPLGPGTSAELPKDGSFSGQFEVAGDQEWIRVRGEVGTHYQFTANGPNPGQSSEFVFPSSMEVLDANGHRMSQALTLDPTVAGDYYLHVLGLTAGKYQLLSHTWADDYPGNNTTSAVLLPDRPLSGVFEYEGDVDRFRVTLEAGKFYTFTLSAPYNYFGLSLLDKDGNNLAGASGNSGGPGMQLMYHPSVSGQYFLDADHSLQTRPQVDPLPYAVSVGAAVADDIGDHLSDAAAISVGSRASGVLQASIDTDMFKVRLQAGGSYAVVLQAAGGERDDLKFSLYAADGSLISNADSWGNRYTAMFKYNPAASADYYIGVGSGSGGVHPYTLRVQQLDSDTSGPVMVATTHAPGATGVALDADTIVLTFNEAISPDHVNDIALLDSQGQRLYFDYDDAIGHSFPTVNDNKIIIKLHDYLTPGTYTLLLPHASIPDLAGNAYTGPESITFSTVQPVATATVHDDLLLGTTTGPGRTIDGGAGIDTVWYGPNSYLSGYTITRNGGNVAVHHAAYPDQTDLLSNVERLLFDRQAYALDIDGHGGQAYRIYQAAFNRAPDSAGLGFWMAQMDRGMSLHDVAKYFVTSPEFIGLYGATPSDADYIKLMYNNVLHRAPDAEGFDFWSSHMRTGATREDVLAYFSESPENQAALATVIGNGFAYTPFHG
jgi:hypothetical protein